MGVERLVFKITAVCDQNLFKTVASSMHVPSSGKEIGCIPPQ